MDDKMKMEYDENGFDRNWFHRITGTRYDENGFNKDGTIHKDTNTAFDTFGFRREYYKNTPAGIRLFKKTLVDIFLQISDYNNTILQIFDGEHFDKIGISYNDILKIEVNGFYLKEKNNYERPKKLDGTPDYRYNIKYRPNTFLGTVFTIVFYDKFSPKSPKYQTYIIKANLTIENVKKSVESYNLFFKFMEDDILNDLHKELLNIKKLYILHKKEKQSLREEICNRNELYQKLLNFKSELNYEQHKKLDTLVEICNELKKKNENKTERIKKDIDAIKKTHVSMTQRIEQLKEIHRNSSSQKVFNELVGELDQVVK